MIKIECEYDKERRGANCKITVEGYSDELAAEVASMLLSVRKSVNEQMPKMVSAGDQVIARALDIYLSLLGKEGEFYNEKRKMDDRK